MSKSKPIIMVGPDLYGHGGISSVARSLKSCGLFSEQNIVYIPTVASGDGNDLVFLLKHYVQFLRYMFFGVKVVYLHTSSYRSFYRKAIFFMTAKLFCKKVVLHIHPAHFKEFVEGLEGRQRLLVQFLLNRVDVFIALSHSMESWIAKRQPGTPTWVINNPVDIAALQQQEDASPRKENSLLYLGWFVPAKGVYDLVDAVSALLEEGMDIEVEMYGNKQVEKLRQYVEEKGHADQIHVNGWIWLEEKIAALHSATMLVLPSYSEGLPNVVLEAMATNTPLISTQVGGLQELLVDGENSIVAEAGNIASLKEAIRRALEDDELREHIARQAFAQVTAQYDLPVVKRRYEQVIATF